MTNDIYMPFDQAEEFMIETFTKLGVPLEDAKICADVLIESDKRGIESHGVNRLKPIYVDRLMSNIQKPITKIDVIKESPTTAVLDANHGMGMVASHYAMNLAIKKAKNLGMGMVAVRNSTHYGIAGYYVSMATEQNMIGMTGTNARPSIAPTFSVENMLGTNPLTIGIPTDEAFPFILDCATSITQRGKIEKLARSKKDTPEGMVIGSNGQAMTDSNQILTALLSGEAALAPLGGIGEELAGYKGYGYATVVEILSAALQSGNYLRMLTGINSEGEKVPYGLGHFFMAVDTEAFMGAEEFKKTAGNILRELRNAKLAPNQSRIYTAGEKEHLAYKNNKSRGVKLDKSLQEDFSKIREMLQI